MHDGVWQCIGNIEGVAQSSFAQGWRCCKRRGAKCDRHEHIRRHEQPKVRRVARTKSEEARRQAHATKKTIQAKTQPMSKAREKILHTIVTSMRDAPDDSGRSRCHEGVKASAQNTPCNSGGPQLSWMEAAEGKSIGTRGQCGLGRPSSYARPHGMRERRRSTRTAGRPATPSSLELVAHKRSRSHTVAHVPMHVRICTEHRLTLCAS